ncbi:MAG: tRNA (adenosine(37)-N6)-threonylcarbamoyltransferase complex dimerization subunit type 1 TsaB [Limisphaerales bacterium]
MKILALEFSSPQRSVAAFEAGGLGAPENVAEAIETGGISTKSFAMIDGVLREAGWEREQIGCIAIGLGPGSYTGIRTAIAIAQGWELATEVKLIGVSSIDCVAAQAQSDGVTGRIAVVVDAQRREFYTAAYELTRDSWRAAEPVRLVTEPEMHARAKGAEVVVGPEVTNWFAGGKTVFPRAAILARLANEETTFIRGEQLEPIYLRATTFVKAPPPRLGNV